MTDIFSQINQSLFDEPADHSWIGPAAGNSRSFEVMFSNISKQGFSKPIICSFWEGDILIRIMSFPFFFDCVNVENFFFLTILDDFGRRCADG